MGQVEGHRDKIVCIHGFPLMLPNSTSYFLNPTSGKHHNTIKSTWDAFILCNVSDQSRSNGYASVSEKYYRESYMYLLGTKYNREGKKRKRKRKIGGRRQ